MQVMRLFIGSDKGMAPYLKLIMDLLPSFKKFVGTNPMSTLYPNLLVVMTLNY